MNKPVIKKAIVKDRLYFDEKDCNFDEIHNLFLYHYGEDHFSTLDFLEYNEEETHPTKLALPANAMHKVTILVLDDQRTWQKLGYQLEYEGQLRKGQQDIVDKFVFPQIIKSGIIQAACGFGKTYTGCSLIGYANVKTLVLVHTKLLFRQWIEELENQFPHSKIGKIGDGLFELHDITVAIYKSAYNRIDKIRDHFSLVLLDECHLAPAHIFSQTLGAFSAKVKIGLSATPERRDGRHKMLPDFFTDFIVIGEDTKEYVTPKVRIIPTDIPFPIRDPKKEWSKQLTVLCSNSLYIRLISNHAIKYINEGRCILIIASRVQILRDLKKQIPNSALVIGATKESEREDILNNAGTKYKVLLTTTLFDYGVSCHRLDTVFLTCPSGNLIALQQRIGRIEREHPDKKSPLVIDFSLSGIIVKVQLQKRINWYKSKINKPKKEAYEIVYG